MLRFTTSTNLEAFILKDPLDCSVLPVGRELCLEDHSERAVAYNLALRVLHLPRFTREAILDFLADYLYSGSQLRPLMDGGQSREGTYPPCASSKMLRAGSATLFESLTRVRGVRASVAIESMEG